MSRIGMALCMMVGLLLTGCGESGTDRATEDQSISIYWVDWPPAYALVETIRTLIRLLLPFLIIIAVSLMTRPDHSDRLKSFYVKMRTPVLVDRKQDQAELARSLQNPDRFRDRLLMPGSQFEFFKWNRIDTIGFGLSVLMVFCIIGFLHLLLNLGA